MFLMTPKMSALALLVAVSLSGCAAQQAATPAPAVQKTVTTPEKTGVLKRELADGLYEMVLNQKGDALFVASSEGFKDVQGGVVYHARRANGLRHELAGRRYQRDQHRRRQSQKTPDVHRAQQRGFPVWRT
jgi:hypothetical protein